LTTLVRLDDVLAPFVDVAWLSAHRDEVVLCDVRWSLGGPSGREAYESGHLPGAVWVDLDRDLAAPASDAAGRHPLPTPQHFARAMAALGIGDDDTVVAYDDDRGAIAARLVWMLRVTGHDAALLDGGIGVWEEELSTAPVARPPTTFTARPWPADRLAGIDDAAATTDVLIDARAADRYAGAADAVDPRPGHIPGARSLPTREHAGPDGRLRDRNTLRERFAAVGIGEGTPVVSYCGSGVTACHNLLVLEQAGLGPGRLFPGSWSQWSRDPSRPAETGSSSREAPGSSG
jgi:thiosulfate/3-mercaptopyruvate sulfurtransferase